MAPSNCIPSYAADLALDLTCEFGPVRKNEIVTTGCSTTFAYTVAGTPWTLDVYVFEDGDARFTFMNEDLRHEIEIDGEDMVGPDLYPDAMRACFAHAEKLQSRYGAEDAE